MSNTLATCNIIAKEALAILQNSLGFAANVSTDWQQEFEKNQSRGYSPGAVINIKRPPRYTYRAGRVSVPQATTETSVPLTLSQGGADLGFTSFESTLSLQQKERKIQAAVIAVVNEIDRQGLDLARTATFNALNPTGALPATQLAATQVFTGINQKLDEMGAPRDKQRALVMGPALNGGAVAGLAGLFNDSGKVSKQYGSGMMVESLGLICAMDQNVAIQANGAATATNVNGAGQIGSNITVVATAGGTLTKGTSITLPGVFAVNPQSRVTTNQLANFVVTADVLVGSTVIPISPAIVTSGAFQNASASPTTGAPYVIIGAVSTSYSANIGFHKDAFTLAMVPMWMPPGGKGVIDVGTASDDGYSVKVTTFYDGVNDFAQTRLDVLFGWVATYPELACKYYTV